MTLLSGRSLWVLIADDQPGITGMMAEMLRDLGASRVICVSDGKEALEALAQAGGRVDIIIGDWNMPHYSGLELLQKVREVDPEIPFLIMTGRDDARSVVLAKEAGVSAYLRKPIQIDQVRTKFSLLVRQARELAQRRIAEPPAPRDWAKLDPNAAQVIEPRTTEA